MPLPTTQEEHAAELRNARLLRWSAAALMVPAGLAVGALAWTETIGGGTWLSLVPAPILVVGGVLVARDAAGLDLTPDPRLPMHADLPDADPRKRCPLAWRRRQWLLAVQLAWLGPASGTALALGAQDTLPPLARFAGFLALSYGAIALSAWWMRRAVGSRLWPRR